MNDDTISRREAIDAIEELKNRYFDRKVVLAKAQDAVNNLPTAEKVGTWNEVENKWGGLEIRCSECSLDLNHSSTSRIKSHMSQSKKSQQASKLFRLIGLPCSNW